MLVGPLQGEDGSGVVVETADVVATAVVVLGVKEPVDKSNAHANLRTSSAASSQLNSVYALPISVVSVPLCFVETIVTAPERRTRQFEMLHTTAPTVFLV